MTLVATLIQCSVFVWGFGNHYQWHVDAEALEMGTGYMMADQITPHARFFIREGIKEEGKKINAMLHNKQLTLHYIGTCEDAKHMHYWVFDTTSEGKDI